jgi:hypothetical protein
MLLLQLQKLLQLQLLSNSDAVKKESFGSLFYWPSQII